MNHIVVETDRDDIRKQLQKWRKNAVSNEKDLLISTYNLNKPYKIRIQPIRDLKQMIEEIKDYHDFLKHLEMSIANYVVGYYKMKNMGHIKIIME